MGFRGALYVLYNVLFGRNRVRKALCLLSRVVLPVLVLLHQPHLQAHAWHPACPGTRRLVRHSRVHPVVKGHAMGQCCMFHHKAAFTGTL